MSRKLGAIALVLGILVCSMSVKTALNNNHSNGPVLVANGPDPFPQPPKPGGKG